MLTSGLCTWKVWLQSWRPAACPSPELGGGLTEAVPREGVALTHGSSTRQLWARTQGPASGPGRAHAPGPWRPAENGWMKGCRTSWPQRAPSTAVTLKHALSCRLSHGRGRGCFLLLKEQRPRPQQLENKRSRPWCHGLPAFPHYNVSRLRLHLARFLPHRGQLC